MSYSVAGYGGMITDQVRMAAYEKALRQAIKPGALVLDIGTGTGIFALLACRFGARQVIAIEPNDAIQVARQMAAANGCAEKITFIHDLSTRVELPERADVIISDLRGVLPLFQYHIPSLIDARTRLLAPDGILLPQCDTLWAAVVEAPEVYTDFALPWDSCPYGFDLHAARRIVMNTWCKARVKPEQLVTEPQPWATLDYRQIETPNMQANLTLEVTRRAVGHGLLLWFDATLMEGITFSNSPTAPKAIYGSAFFPWVNPVALESGDTVSSRLRADLVGEDYVWGWDTCVHSQGAAQESKANFKQSTFWGAPLTLDHLRKQRADYVPTLSINAKIDHFILTQMTYQHTVGEIAQAVVKAFPQQFHNWQAALTRVGELSQKYSDAPK